MQASLLAVSGSPMQEELGPYLRWVLDRLPPGWDEPRTGACPPYEGIGKIDVELVSAGADPAATAAVLREKLGAVERDARSWVEHAPCVIKRGAMRADAMDVALALKPLGARVTLHGLTGGREETPPEASAPAVAEKKPWWKLW
jgi:hypothetical protein